VSNVEEPKVPTTAVTTSVIASIQVQQALMTLHGLEEGLKPGERLSVYLKPFAMIKDTLPLNTDCLAHFTVPHDLPVLDIPSKVTVREAIQAAQTSLLTVNSLSLPFEFVTHFVCSACDTRERIMQPKESVLQAQARCPTCKQLRLPEVINKIDTDSPYVSLKLNELGIPEKEILNFTGSIESIYLQFGK
jgi:hypothetical protein